MKASLRASLILVFLCGIFSSQYAFSQGDGGGGDGGGGESGDGGGGGSGDGGSNEAVDPPAPPSPTPEELATARARALEAARLSDADFAKANKGYKAGFNYFLEKNPPAQTDGFIIAYSEAQINEAKENARRLSPVYEQKIDELITQIKADIGFDKQSRAFQAAFNDNLDRKKFAPVVSVGSDGKATLNVEVPDGILKGSLHRTIAASIASPEEKERAEKAREASRARLKEAEASLREVAGEACAEIRARRDRNFQGGQTDPASLEIQNNIQSFQ